MLDWLKRGITRPGGRSEPDGFLPGSVVRQVSGAGWAVQLDLAAQVLRLSIPEETGGRFRLDHLEAVDAETLEPTARASEFVSGAMLAVYAKTFDDGLYAAADLASQPRKAKLIASLQHCSQHLAAAAALGSGTNADDGNDVLRAFLANELRSKPLGFYTWSPQLKAVFRQDRVLQDDLDDDAAERVRATLVSDPLQSESYEWALRLMSRLTNPFVKSDFRNPSGRVFFPASRSHEGDLAQRLYGDKPVPEGWSLMQAVLDAIKKGLLDTTPSAASGWYDYQTWALAALARLENEPEGSRLRLDQSYREHLDELFKGVLAVTRETHVKQLDITSVGAAGFRLPGRHVFVGPSLSVEPLATYFDRRARGYAFVRDVLQDAGLLDTMHRVTPTGPVARPLEEELADVERLFRSAASVARQELGLAAAHEDDRRRLRDVASRRDALQADVRMMVPVFVDLRMGVKVWALLGWTSHTLEVAWDREPSFTVVKGRVSVKTSRTTYQLATPVFAELYVRRLLDRDEFRAVCDKHRTRQAILAALAKA